MQARAAIVMNLFIGSAISWGPQKVRRQSYMLRPMARKRRKQTASSPIVSISDASFVVNSGLILCTSSLSSRVLCPARRRTTRTRPCQSWVAVSRLRST